eukprot:s194_g25.t1
MASTHKVWSENFKMYRRDEFIQQDLEILTEPVFDMYQKHLDKLIRSNDKLWGVFCLQRKDPSGNILGLELVMPPGWKKGDPAVEMNKDHIIPQPELHFSFSTKMLLLAVQLYRQNVEYTFHPFPQFAFEKLVSYVESRKKMAQESYRHFVEHAYNQFFVHQAFHESSRSRTRAKDSGATEPFGVSTISSLSTKHSMNHHVQEQGQRTVELQNLSGYPQNLMLTFWIQDSTGTRRIPKSRVDEDPIQSDDPPQAQDTPMVDEFPEGMRIDYDDDDQQASPVQDDETEEVGIIPP